MKKILVTGGAGYIGSHTCVQLLESNYEVVVVDNLSNSKKISIQRVEQITNKKIKFYEVDICDYEKLRKVFLENNFYAVIHFAGLKAVGESVKIPLKYYDNNLTGSIKLFELMNEFDVKNIVFSSSATVYGDPHKLPIDESFPLYCTNAYGRTKLFIEYMLQDIYTSDHSWNPTLLRYFNPVGAHKSGLIGEDPNGIPNNLSPYVAQVAVGKLPKLSVYGNDYKTRDGTGCRDYIHVLDLAAGHVAAVKFFEQKSGLKIYNLGTGRSYSVLEVVEAFKKASGRDIPYAIAPRRTGDVAEIYADASLAYRDLGWKAKYDLEEMCADTWRWQQMNPKGFE